MPHNNYNSSKTLINFVNQYINNTEKTYANVGVIKYEYLQQFKDTRKESTIQREITLHLKNLGYHQWSGKKNHRSINFIINGEVA